MTSSEANSKITFQVGANDTGAVATFQTIGREMDKLAAKQAKLKGPPSDRQFNKALGQDSAGDLLELLGVGSKGLAVAQKAGALALITKGFEKIGTEAGVVADTLRDVVGGQKKWNDELGDFFRSVPILGYAVKGFDGIREAITGEGRAIEQLKIQAEAASKGYEKLNAERHKLMDGVAGNASKAFQELAIAGAPDQALAKAQAELNAERANIQKQRDEAKRLGINSGDVKAGLDLQEAVAREKYNQAWRDSYNRQAKDQESAAEESKKKQIEIAKSAADAEFEYRQKMLRAGGNDLMADIEAARRKAAQAAGDAKSERERRAILAGGAVDEQSIRDNAIKSVQDRINALRGDETARVMEIARQTRPGALAESLGLGSASQIASRERASANPMLKLVESQQRTGEKQLQVLTEVLSELRKGNLPPIPVFN